MLTGDNPFNLPKLEEKVLEFWRQKGIFEKSMARRKGKKSFVFYEGPPTANGRPGIHHILARSFKDIIPRYRTMRGYFVARKGGWDTHGLPVELEVEKMLGLKSKKEIEQYGIAAFNKKCRESVWQYKDEWERLTERMGFWVDLKNPYITYENNYIETLWWIIKKFFEKGLMYLGHKVVPWCSRCGTALSSHELAQGYKEVTDQSVYLKFRLKHGQKVGDWTTTDRTYVLSWTTTPWTLPGNVALAVGENIDYKIVETEDGEMFIFAKEREAALGVSGKEVATVPGSRLLGLEYFPLFQVSALVTLRSYRIYPADFVTTTDGTGVVHTAVMYGEDDYQLGTSVGLPQYHTVTEEGMFTQDVVKLAGMAVKAPETEAKIFEHLTKNNNLLRVEPYVHEYPHCWRCGTPLLYFARSSWFVSMSKLRTELLRRNKKINWIPEHIKEGRFGEWLREVKDWNFSRERYWGTPLPIWHCESCKSRFVPGSMDELMKADYAKNTFYLLRHTEAESIVKKLVACGPETDDTNTARLTAKGRKDAELLAKKLLKHKFSAIYASPYARTKEFAEMVHKATGAPLFLDDRLGELNVGSFAWHPTKEYNKFFATDLERFTKKPDGAENLRDVRSRVMRAAQDINKKYRGRNILIVGHGDPLWILEAAMRGIPEEASLKMPYIKTGEMRKVSLRNLSYDESGQVDLHRPYIDELFLECAKCEGKMVRVKEVADVWFDSGSMPLAQAHYPFDGKMTIEKKSFYPADFISEAMDQTRGWFYTLLAVATALGLDAPYKNVISLGLIHDKFGQKMSKSKGNVVDPWMMMEKYGVDAVRWYFYTATPAGEPKNFDEAEVGKSFRKFHAIIWNSFVFYKTYAAKGAVSVVRPKHILDRWILARLNDTIAKTIRALDAYEIRDAGLTLEALVDDLSRWYIRRSRRRFQKPASTADHREATATLGLALREFSKLIAPFSPFFAEGLYEGLGSVAGKTKESVHLEDFPTAKRNLIDRRLLRSMEDARRISSLGLAKRAEIGIKVRQPLASLTVKEGGSVRTNKELLAIVKEEVNVKEVKFDKNLTEELVFDTVITAELKEEGMLREMVRTAQDLRQEAGFSPKDTIVFMIEAPEAARIAIQKNENAFRKDIGAKSVEYKRGKKFGAELSTKIDEGELWMAVRKP